MWKFGSQIYIALNIYTSHHEMIYNNILGVVISLPSWQRRINGDHKNVVRAAIFEIGVSLFSHVFVGALSECPRR